jgi:hypothetical protein
MMSKKKHEEMAKKFKENDSLAGYYY